MVYSDTTALVPLFFEGATSFEAQSLVAGPPNRVPTVSDRGRVEFSPLPAKEVRMRGLSSPEASEIERRFEAAIDASFTLFGATLADFDLAKARIADHGGGLRSGDALHPAIATNDRNRSFCGFDKVPARTARAFGLLVDLGPSPH